MLEVLSALVLLVLAVRKPRVRRPHPVRIALGTAPIVLVVGLLTFVGVGSAVAAMPVAFNLHDRFGMSMTVNYFGVSTPYKMGSRSGNVPE